MDGFPFYLSGYGINKSPPPLPSNQKDICLYIKGSNSDKTRSCAGNHLHQKFTWLIFGLNRRNRLGKQRLELQIGGLHADLAGKRLFHQRFCRRSPRIYKGSGHPQRLRAQGLLHFLISAHPGIQRLFQGNGGKGPHRTQRLLAIRGHQMGGKGQGQLLARRAVRKTGVGR